MALRSLTGEGGSLPPSGFGQRMVRVAGEEKIVGFGPPRTPRPLELLPDGLVAVAGAGLIGRTAGRRFHLTRPAAGRATEHEPFTTT